MLVLSDIDGVVCDPRRLVKIYLSGPVKNWGGYFKHTDELPPIQSVIAIINGLVLHGAHQVIFGTSRPESNRTATVTWLQRYLGFNVPSTSVLMRQVGDHNAGSLIKLQWAFKYHPELILEDEPETVSLLRDKGFNVLQLHGYRVDAKDNIP